MGGAGWLCRVPGYIGTGAPVWELGGIKPEDKEVDGMKLVGGTPGLGMGGRPPGVDDGGWSGGRDKVAAGTDGPGGGKALGPPTGIG